jgi:hypothetical protein
LASKTTASIMSLIQLGSLSPEETIIKLPHPYQTEYTIHKANRDNATQFQIDVKPTSSSNVKQPPFNLHSPNLRFTEPIDLKSSELPSQSNNGPWARARRSPCSSVHWDGNEAPTLAHSWLLLYVLFTVRPSMETLRLEIRGTGAQRLGQQLKDVLLAVSHPLPPAEQQQATAPQTSSDYDIVLALRSTFWQGAGSPFGPRPAWCPQESPASLAKPLSSYPLTPLHNTMTIQSAGDPQDPDRYQQAWHPIRPAKPAPGAVIYSRWIPHLRETFSMVSLDWENAEHLRLFHDWQNDPRVSQGWNETGTLEQHREYLRKIHIDPHQVAVLALWDDVPFAYFEIYWAKVRFLAFPSSPNRQES